MKVEILGVEYEYFEEENKYDLKFLEMTNRLLDYTGMYKLIITDQIYLCNLNFISYESVL